MATRNVWNDLYAIGKQTAFATPVDTTIGLPLLNHPDINPGQAVIDQRKAIGVPFRNTSTGYEFQQGVQTPSATFEFDVSAYNTALLFWSFFQNGAIESSASNYPKYFIPYQTRTSDDPGTVYTMCEVWLTILRKMAASAADCHQITGAIAKTITLSAEVGMPLKASIEFIGKSYSDDVAVGSNAFTFSSNAPLLWANATVTLGGNAINCDGFTITASNNATAKCDDAGNPLRIILGDFTVEGTIKVPWSTATEGGNQQIDDFVNGSTDRLLIYWGNEIAASAGDFSIMTRIRRNGATTVGEDELSIEIPFIGGCNLVSTSVSTSSVSTIAVAGTGAVTGTNTVFNTFSKGDILYPFGCTAAGDRVHRVATAIGGATALTASPAFSGTEGSKNYKIMASPLTITLADNVQLSI